MRELDMDYCIERWHEMFDDQKLQSFSRFGDGEFACMLGSGPSNCDRHPYTAELAKDLIEAFTKPRSGVIYGIQRLVVEQRADEMFDLLDARGKFQGHTDEYTLTAGDVFHHMSKRGQLGPVVDYLTRAARTVAFVGPQHLEHLPFIKPLEHLLIEVPRRNCYAEVERIMASMMVAYRYGRRFFSLSCSMMAEVIIHELAPKMPGAVMIDFGSMWDPYCGIQSRTYHKKHTTAEWLEKLS